MSRVDSRGNNPALIPKSVLVHGVETPKEFQTLAP
jgi:hypothetical protein